MSESHGSEILYSIGELRSFRVGRSDGYIRPSPRWRRSYRRMGWPGWEDRRLVTEIATMDTDTKVPAWEIHTPKEGWPAYVEHDDALMLYNGTGLDVRLQHRGNPAVRGTNNTGAGSPSLGANCPAVMPTAQYTWILVKTADRSTAYIPVWK